MKALSVILILLTSSIFATNNHLFTKLDKFKTNNQVLNDVLLKNISNKKDFGFFIKKVQKGLGGVTYYHYGYKYKGITIENKSFIISKKKNKAFLLTGKFIKPEIKLLKNKTSASEIFKNFKSKVKKIKFHSKIEETLIFKDKKSYSTYKALIEYSDKKGYHLGVIYLDTNTGKKLLFKSHVYEAINRKIYDFNNNCIDSEDSYALLPGTLSIDEGGNLGTDNAANDAYINSGITYWFYKHMLNRDSFDNNGIHLSSTVHARFDLGEGCEGGNAFFMGSPYDQMVYGDGNEDMNYLSQSLDVTAHELTHAVTDRTSNLIYENESGALNEAMSDIFGATVEAWSNSGGTSIGNPEIMLADENTWKIGEDIMINREAMRFMNNPHLSDVPEEYKPDHYNEKYTGEYDAGGVHINSGIINLAYYLLVTGGNHPREKYQELFLDVEGLGLEKSIKIFYEAQIGLLGNSSDFRFAREMFSQAAENLYGNCSNESEQVNRAFDIVGIPGNRKSECNNIHSCEGITCGNNGSCQLENNNAVCVCNEGYTTLGLNCIENKSDEVCSAEFNARCATVNAHCYDYDGQPACTCNDGFHVNDSQDACIPNDSNFNPCEGVNCSDSLPNTHCIDNNGEAACICDDGYSPSETGNGCISDQIDVCFNINCSGNGICINDNDFPVCYCDEGYINDENLNCIKDNSSLCDSITCSNHGDCVILNGNANCNCDNGYKNENLDCILDTSLLCDNITCSNHGDCVVVDNNANCICENGFQADGLTCINDDFPIINGGVNSATCDYNSSSKDSFLLLIILGLFLVVIRRKYFIKN